MKKLIRSTWIMIAAVGVLFFVGCDTLDDEEGLDAPSVSFVTDPADAVVEAGSSFGFTVNITAPAGFNTVRLEAITATGGTINLPSTYQTEYTRNDLNLTAEDTEASAEFQSIIFLDAGEFDLEFVAVDEAGISTEAILTVTVTEVARPIATYTQILVYAPAGDGSTNTWFSTNLGETVTEAEVNANSAPNSVDVDFGYYYGVSDLATIASPLAYNLAGINISDWNTRNATEFKLTTLSNEEYLGISSGAGLETIWDRADNINEGGTISNLEVGDIVSFQLDTNNKGGLYGVFRVLDIEPGDNTNDYIEIEVIVEDAQ